MQHAHNPIMPPVERRQRRDRRTLSAKTFLYSIFIGRRRGPQRCGEKAKFFYTDVYDAKLFLVVILIAVLSATDAGLTLLILEKGGTELNPLMDWALGFSNPVFFTIKYLLTISGLLTIVVHINFRLFERIPLPNILAGLLGFYTVLVSYEISILAA
jgi:Domain of unknown function (DUF5658)